VSSLFTSIQEAEVISAIKTGETVLADVTLEAAYNELYQIKRSSCGGEMADPSKLKCLYLLLIHLQYLYTNRDLVDTTEEELINILTVVERTSKSCCPQN
jgi:hypothetical protein